MISIIMVTFAMITCHLKGYFPFNTSNPRVAVEMIEINKMSPSIMIGTMVWPVVKDITKYFVNIYKFFWI